MLEAIWSGLVLVMDWQVLGLMLFATVLGNFFGVVPGLGGNIGLALLIPFVFGMESFHGLAFLLAMHSVVHTGGAVPSVLFGIPGTGPTAATILDGHPMTRQGRGSEALGAVLAASAIGGIIGAGVLALLIPVMKPLAVAFGAPEIFMLIVFGLTLIVVVTRDAVGKGFISAFIGLLLGTVGLDPHTGVGRYTFGQLWLWDGIHVIPLVLGLFAFAEMFTLGAKGARARIATMPESLDLQRAQLFDGVRAVFGHKWLALRTAVIGTVIGIIPGLGGDAASWICYGHTVQTSKDKSRFGKGDIRGIIGVETANNSKEGGSLLPTLVFGVPGSSGMAILLGAFLILGITPGPSMITDNLDMIWGMVWVMVFANILGALMLLPLSPTLGRLAFIRNSLIIPTIILFATLGAYLINNRWQDVLLAFVFGIVGLAMKRGEYPRAPLVLGFILGPLAEDYLHKSLAVYGVSFLLRPIVVSLLVASICSLVFSFRSITAAKTPDEVGCYE